LQRATRTLTVTVSCPRDAANRTSVTVSLYGKARAGNQDANTNILYLTSTVNYIPPSPSRRPLATQIRNFFMKPTLLTTRLCPDNRGDRRVGRLDRLLLRLKRAREEEEVVPRPAPLPQSRGAGAFREFI